MPPSPSDDSPGCQQTSHNLGSGHNTSLRLEEVEGARVGCCLLTASVKSSWSGGLTVALDWAHSSVPSPTSVPGSSSWTKTSCENQECLTCLDKQAVLQKALSFANPPRSQALSQYIEHETCNRPLMEEPEGTAQARDLIAWKIMATSALGFWT